MDHHVPAAITVGLRGRGIYVITSGDDKTTRFADDRLLDRAADLKRVLFTQDADFLAIASSRQRMGLPFAGLIYGHQRRISISQAIHDLELIATVYDLVDMANRVEYLPL
jgi:hypothetical protein